MAGAYLVKARPGDKTVGKQLMVKLGQVILG